MHKYNTPVAVLMCVYQRDSLPAFDQALRSLLNQKHVNIVLFLHIDGPVSNGFYNICTNYREEELDIRIIESERNVGLAIGLNKLIDEVSATLPEAEYIARFDADDICVEDRLIKQVEYLQNNKEVGVLGTACFEFSDNINVVNYTKRLPESDVKIKEMLAHGCPFVHPSVMFRRNVFQLGYRYPDIHLSEDLALWFLLRSQGVVFANLAEPLIYYRLSDKTIGRRLGLKKGIGEFLIRISNFSFHKDGFRSLLLISSRLIVHIFPLTFFKRLRKIYLSNYE